MHARFSLGLLALLPVVLAAACSSDDEVGALPDADAGPTRDAAPAPTQQPDAAPTGPTTDASDAAPAPTRVPVFVAQGTLGRTTISCDDGQTWVAEHSQYPDARCFDDTSANNMECDHNAWSAAGIAVAGDYFLTTYGHGEPGVVQRSEDGVTWENVLEGHWFAGLAVGAGKVVAVDGAPWISPSFGAKDTWTALPGIEQPGGAVRGGTFVPDAAGTGGTFLLLADGNVVLRSTDATTWTNNPTTPEGCARNGFVSGNGVVLNVNGQDGTICRSADAGATWTHAKVADNFGSQPVFANGTFQIWAGDKRWSSADGVTWTSEAVTGANVGAVAVGPSGTYVAVNGGWQVWYEKQRFYRSTDGLTWTELPAGSFTGSHPISSIVTGWAKPSTLCPL